MFEKLIESLKFTSSNDDQDTRREHQRHNGGRCVAIIDDITYPVANWSKGGVMILGDDRPFGVYDIKNVTLRFKLDDKALDIDLQGHILRKGRDKLIIQFSPLSQNTERQFNFIVDDVIAREFMQSQMNA
jgi:hypothetical protein